MDNDTSIDESVDNGNDNNDDGRYNNNDNYDEDTIKEYVDKEQEDTKNIDLPI